MEFFDALVRYEVRLWSVVDQELARRDLVSLGQLHALRVIARYEGRARVQDLTRDIGITVGAVSKLVDRLERDGLATRSPNPANRRSSLIALTGSGRRSLSEALAVAQSVLDRAIGDEDVEPLVEGFGRLDRRLDEGVESAA